MSRQSYVYFIKPVGLPGPIKIGFSVNTRERLLSLGAWSPLKLEIIAEIPGTCQLEKNIQDCLLNSHSHHEWFFPTDEVISVVEAIKAGIPIEEAVDLTNRVGSIRTRGLSGWTESTKKRASYSTRIRNLHWKGYKTPQQIESILRKWDRDRSPSSEDIALLDVFISDGKSFLEARSPNETAA
jgi:hypothetical protein